MWKSITYTVKSKEIMQMYIIIIKLYRPQDIIVEMNSFFFLIFLVCKTSVFQ